MRTIARLNNSIILKVRCSLLGPPEKLTTREWPNMLGPEGGQNKRLKGTWLEQEDVGGKVVGSNLGTGKVFHPQNLR